MVIKTTGQRFEIYICYLSIAVAVFYTSWVLGYILNYRVAISNIVSDLSISSEPYSWVFQISDYLVAFLAIAISALGIKYIAKSNKQKLLWFFYGFFGFFTLIATIFHVECVSALHFECHAGTVYNAHILSGILANISLFIASVIAAYQYADKLSVFLIILFAIWIFSGLSVLAVPFSENAEAIAIFQRIGIISTTVFVVLVPRLLMRSGID